MLEHGPWRAKLNAATMLELSKTTYQADIDAACETLDFIRANVKNMLDMYGVQPTSRAGEWNSAEYRPLEGFVFAVTPFNFTCMNNLAFGPAVLGNTVVWKPAESASLVAHLSLQLLREAGLPDGVINIVYGDGAEIGDVALNHRDLAAVHFTGSTGTFQHIWRTVGANVANYKQLPARRRRDRRQGLHRRPPVGRRGRARRRLRPRRLRVPGAEVLGRVAAVRTAQPVAGAARAARRAHRERRRRRPDRDRDLRRRGDQRQAARQARRGARPRPRRGPGRRRRQHRRLGRLVRRPHRPAGRGPALAVHHPGAVRARADRPTSTTTPTGSRRCAWSTSRRPYGLTGAVFAEDAAAVRQADDALRYTAGNFYVNDKPTGSVVGAQPFGGARASGTNDKAGTVWNLIRFASPRSTKRNHLPATDYRYPHLDG